MRGWATIWQQPTKESNASARDYFERAIKIDPQNAEAMVGLAYALTTPEFSAGVVMPRIRMLPNWTC